MAGCLQSVLDEYVHVLRDSLGLIDAGLARIASQLAHVITQVVGLRVATPNVDEITLSESGLHIQSSAKKEPRTKRLEATQKRPPGYERREGRFGPVAGSLPTAVSYRSSENLA